MSKLVCSLAAFVTALLLAPSNCLAKIITVPGDASTIQEGIDAAVNGDTVEVSPGTYVENINFKDKLITVTSTGGPGVTIIDGAAKDSVVSFKSGEPAFSALSGFTITNGSAGFDNSYDGGGIFIQNSSPTISGNVISYNSGNGGIGILGGAPLIEDNTIRNNNGGGMYLSFTSATISHNVIMSNISGSGGGITMSSAGTPLIVNNTISGNIASPSGGGLYMDNNSEPVIVQNTIVNNIADQGGGVYILAFSPGPLLVNNTIAENLTTATQGSAAYIAGFDSGTMFFNNLLIARSGQNAVFCDSVSTKVPPEFIANDAFSAGGTAFEGACASALGSFGNISVQPSFVNSFQGDFHLVAGSRGIDVGSNSAPELSGTDLDGLPRIVDGSGRKSFIVDMGAYEFQPVVMSPTSLDFGEQALKSRTRMALTLTNQQKTALSVTGVSASGDFSPVSGCPTSLAAGSSCSITIDFAPTALGVRSGEVTVDDNDTNGPRKADLSGMGVIATATPTPLPTASSTPLETTTPNPTQTPTPTPTATQTALPTASPSPAPGQPFISLLEIPPFDIGVVIVGGNLDIVGSGFTPGSRANLFVSTAHGPVKVGRFVPSTQSSTVLTVAIPGTVSLGQGFGSVQVVNTDKGFLASNSAYALLIGASGQGLPTLSAINTVALAPTSRDPAYATNNVETVISPGGRVILGGLGFDATNGVAVDLFCGCRGGKVGPFFINPGPLLTPTTATFFLPAAGSPNSPITGPGSFVVSNAGPSGTYSKKSNAVSVPIGAQISVGSVVETPARFSMRGPTITVNGTGFSPFTVINFFNTQPHGVVNLGGLNRDGTPKVPLTIVNDKQLTFVISSAVAASGPSYVQTLNPPFVPFTSSGNDPGGAFVLK